MIVGIVLYNPDVLRLQENINAIRGQVEEIILIENGSSSLSYIDELNLEKCVIIRNNTNLGIAKALNQICDYCEKKGSVWVLTLDQDSICPSNIVTEYNKYILDEAIGMLCPLIKDRSLPDKIQDKNVNSYVDTCITSGSCIRISAWKKVGGFCDGLFIDSVDTDMCYMLKEHGYKILRVSAVELYHELGHNSKKVRVGRGEGISFNHAPIRYYYIVRNSILLRKRHGLGNWHHIFWRFYIVAIYEEQKKEKIKMMLKGLFHGFSNKYGKLK